MSLTGRFSALFLSALGLVLVGFSTALYVSARIYLDRQVADRLSSALAVLAAAAEIHPDGVEWEPQERVLPLGPGVGGRAAALDGLRRPRASDRSFAEPGRRGLTAGLVPRPGTAELPGRLVDRQGGPGESRSDGSGRRRPRDPARASASRGGTGSSPRDRELPSRPRPDGGRPARPDGGDARRARLVPRRPQRGDLAARGPALPRALAAGPRAPDADGRLGAGARRHRPRLVPGRGRDRRRAGRPGPRVQRPPVPGCTSPSSGSGGSAATPRTSCGRR